MDHPTNSSELAHGALHLFGTLQKYLTCKRFATDADKQQAVTSWQETPDEEFFQAGKQGTVPHWNNCLIVSRESVDVQCVPSATFLPSIHKTHKEVLGISVFITSFILKSFVHRSFANHRGCLMSNKIRGCIRKNDSETGLSCPCIFGNGLSYIRNNVCINKTVSSTGSNPVPKARRYNINHSITMTGELRFQRAYLYSSLYFRRLCKDHYRHCTYDWKMDQHISNEGKMVAQVQFKVICLYSSGTTEKILKPMCCSVISCYSARTDRVRSNFTGYCGTSPYIFYFCYNGERVCII